MQCEMTPRLFAEEELNREAQNFGPRSQIILADIMRSESMVYLSKRTGNNTKFDIDDVDYGFHTISSTGFDDTNSPKVIYI